MKPLDGRTCSFVVKIWEERRDLVEAEPVWRVSVDHVQGHARAYFSSLAELCAYLQAQSGMEAPFERSPLQG